MILPFLVKLALSADGGWAELDRRNPGILQVFLRLVLPLSLLPPATLFIGGPGDAGAGAAAVPRDMAAIGALFFLAEMATFFAMGWLIGQVAKTYALHIDTRRAYLLAAVAPVPLWLSSPGLLFPGFAAHATISIVALGLCCALLYHGLLALGRGRESIVAFRVVQIVVGVGLIIWAPLLALTLV